MSKRKQRRNDVARGLSSSDCMLAIRERFPAPQYALFEQVANGTGFRANRWADAVAMGIWPSRGLELIGFEIKVDRQDWKRELKNPAKSEAVQKYCDRWIIVAPKGLIPPDELPPTWGLTEVSEKRKCTVVVEPPKLNPVPLDRSIVAALLRRHGEVRHSWFAKEYQRGLEEGAQNGHGDLAKRLERAQQQLRDLEGKVEEFEKASGLQIRWGWQLGKVGEAVQLLIKGSHHDYIEILERHAKSHQQSADRLREDLDKLRGALPPINHDRS